MEKEFHIHNPTQDIIIRTGSAMPVKEPVALRLNGNINAPKEFYEKRKGLFGKNQDTYSIDNSSVVINEKEGKITLTIDESNAYYGRVEGKLTLNPVLEKLKVNDDNFQGFIPADLAKILRMNRQFFINKEFFNDLVTRLQDFKATFDTEVQHSDNKRGSVANSVVKRMISEHNYNFALFLPVFEGTPPIEVPIEVDISYSGDSTIRCNLISVELVEIQEKTKEYVFSEYTELFKDFPVIFQ